MTVDSSLEGASPARVVALSVRFLLELALLAGAAVLAWRLAPEGWQWPLAILAPIVVGVVWGLFLSPRARFRMPALATLALEALLFLGVGAGLLFVGLGVPAAIGVGIWVVDRIALALLTPRTDAG